jgi:arylsulfatase A-like enzyme
MNRRDFLAAAGAGLASAQPSPAPPNFVVILADDMGFGDLGANGSAEARTPHMDRLSDGGIRFTDWHANSPVCSPSRAALLTGKYPQRTGIPVVLPSRPAFDVPGLREGETSLAGELRQAGYRTAAIGKWHLGSAPHSRPQNQGFDQFFGFYSGWIDYLSHRYYVQGGSGNNVPAIFHDLWRNDTEVFEDPVYQTELLAREAKSFIAAQTPSKPFFLYLAFGAPHYPMIAPQKYLDRFPASMDRDRRLHLAMVAALDDAVGEVAGELKRRGLDNTVIFFQSDNGATRESRAHYRGGDYRGGSNGRYRSFKGSLFEGGHRVPAWMNWRGHLRAEQIVNAPLMAIDILPTFLKLARRNVPNGVDGLDLSNVLMGGAPPPDRTLYWDYAGQTAVRRGPWKLIEKPNDGLGTPQSPDTWLVDLSEDPEEHINRLSAAPSKAAELREALRAWPSIASRP